MMEAVTAGAQALGGSGGGGSQLSSQRPATQPPATPAEAEVRPEALPCVLCLWNGVCCTRSRAGWEAGQLCGGGQQARLALARVRISAAAAHAASVSRRGPIKHWPSL